MSVDEILPGLFFVQRGFLNANHFAYRAEQPVLIDTGYRGHWEHTRRILVGLGVDPATVGLIINTHAHCDHIGANRQIQALSGCEIALHRIGKHFIDARDDWSTWWRYYDQEAEFFDCTRGLEDGEELTVGPYEFRVIHTPGHAADGIVLHCAREKLLISSDALWEKDIPVMTLRVEGSRMLFDALHSLEKIRRLEARRIYPGHGRPFQEPEGAIARSEKRLRHYLQHPQDMGSDQLKRIIVYNVLMRPGTPETELFDRLMAGIWFPETCQFFFGGNHHRKFTETVAGLRKRGILSRTDGRLHTSVPA